MKIETGRNVLGKWYYSLYIKRDDISNFKMLLEVAMFRYKPFCSCTTAQFDA